MAAHKYNPTRVKKFVKRVPVKGEKKFGFDETWDPHEYPVRVLMQKPKEIIALRSIHHNVMGWEGMQDLLIRHGGVEKVREFPIRSDRIFSEDGATNLVKASKAVAKNVENEKTTVVTCNKGYRRTSGTIYLVHRRMGASHEEALEHSKVQGKAHPFTKEERAHLDELYENRKDYGG